MAVSLTLISALAMSAAVALIIGVVSAIAVPRISGGARGSKRRAWKASVVNVRKAIDHYHAEHGRHPGYE